jgi:type I restriction enzyme S subunit
VPPPSEQKRIVFKVNQLLILIDRLEKQQKELENVADAFASACVASLTGTSIERTEKMKAPKTELVSKVSLAKKPKGKTKAPLAEILGKHKGTLSAKQLWQESGLEIDQFYQSLKTEIAAGWIAEPVEAKMKIIEEA